MTKSSPTSYWVATDDWHTAGEPFRIVPTLPPHCQSTQAITSTTLTVSQRRQEIVNTPSHPIDLLRQALCKEPRGHADMYGGFIVPPNDPQAHFGVLFWHKDGFSTACGHGTIALGCWAIAKGLIQAPHDGEVDVVIDVPSGRVVAKAEMVAGKVDKVHFINVPSYQISAGILVKLRTGQAITVDLGWGGATYAFVDVAQLGLAVEPKRHDEFVALGRQIKAILGDTARHNNLDLYGVCFFEHIDDSPTTITQRNVVVFADGQIDRSPCGSGTAARVAILLAQGQLKNGKTLVHKSIIDTVFEAVVMASAPSATDFPGCVPRVTGLAQLMGEHRFWIDEADPTYPGFLFR
jgi:trans-L-3-hydroxyproline dehydratase